jgi:hypothetical protein
VTDLGGPEHGCNAVRGSQQRHTQLDVEALHHAQSLLAQHTLRRSGADHQHFATLRSRRDVSDEFDDREREASGRTEGGGRFSSTVSVCRSAVEKRGPVCTYSAQACCQHTRKK